METYDQETIYGNFRTPRYEKLNECRWDHFLSMGIPIKGKRIFEPGAGIGDQTEWLLKQGADYIYVNEGRPGNRDIIRNRFGDNSKVSILHGYLEECLNDYVFHVDLIFCYGVYYHLREDYPGFSIMRRLAKLGETIAFDYLAGNDQEVHYGYDNPSTAIAGYALRPRPESMNAALKDCWEFVYEPKTPLQWIDPIVSEQRIVAVASHSKLESQNLVQI